jgi:hypothetical protein
MIRDLLPEDLPALKEIHRKQGFNYNLPDLLSPLFLVKKVREVDGRVVGALCIRLTAETYLLVEGSPVAKGRSIEELQPELIREAYEKGLDDLVFVVPPEIVDEFHPALERLGWSRTRDWPMYQRDLNAISTESSQ